MNDTGQNITTINVTHQKSLDGLGNGMGGVALALRRLAANLAAVRLCLAALCCMIVAPIVSYE